MFQNTICQTLQGLRGVKNLGDDIIVYGTFQSEHDDNLSSVPEDEIERPHTQQKEMLIQQVQA